MKIVDVVCSKARTGFFFDDQRAIKKGAVADGSAYFGETVTLRGCTVFRRRRKGSAVFGRGLYPHHRKVYQA